MYVKPTGHNVCNVNVEFYLGRKMEYKYAKEVRACEYLIFFSWTTAEPADSIVLNSITAKPELELNWLSGFNTYLTGNPTNASALFTVIIILQFVLMHLKNHLITGQLTRSRTIKQLSCTGVQGYMCHCLCTSRTVQVPRAALYASTVILTVPHLLCITLPRYSPWS